MKELIEVIARALVDEPEVVSVTEVGGEQPSIMELRVAKTDIGKFIGKQGCDVCALRALLRAVWARTKKNIVLENHRIP